MAKKRIQKSGTTAMMKKGWLLSNFCMSQFMYLTHYIEKAGTGTLDMIARCCLWFGSDQGKALQSVTSGIAGGLNCEPLKAVIKPCAT